MRSDDLKTTRGKCIDLSPRLGEEPAVEAWERTVSDRESLVVLDLFSGAGGMSYGFHKAGFAVAAGIDADSHACATFAANLPAKAKCADIRSLDPAAVLDELKIPRVDVLVGGPPCQGFSIVGRAKVLSLSKELQEKIYERNQLYLEFVRFVKALKPLFLVMENVPHLSTFADGLVAASIKRDFQKLGYEVDRVLLDATHYGVPQTRRRLFFIGSRIGWIFRAPDGAWIGPEGLPPRTLADAIGDLPPVDAPWLEDTMSYVPSRPELKRNPEYAELMRSSLPPAERGLLYDHVVRPVRDDDLTIFKSMRQGAKYTDVDDDYRRYAIKMSEDGRDLHFSDRYLRLRWDQPCVTITAHMAKDGYRYIHPEQPRTLSVREAARVQSFPDSFRFAGFRTNQFVQIGNAVPPLLSEAIARLLAEVIRDYRQGLRQETYQTRLPGLELPLLQWIDEQ